MLNFEPNLCDSQTCDFSLKQGCIASFSDAKMKAVINETWFSLGIDVCHEMVSIIPYLKRSSEDPYCEFEVSS